MKIVLIEKGAFCGLSRHGVCFVWKSPPHIIAQAKSRGSRQKASEIFEIFIPEIKGNAPNFKN